MSRLPVLQVNILFRLLGLLLIRGQNGKRFKGNTRRRIPGLDGFCHFAAPGKGIILVWHPVGSELHLPPSPKVSPFAKAMSDKSETIGIKPPALPADRSLGEGWNKRNASMGELWGKTRDKGKG